MIEYVGEIIGNRLADHREERYESKVGGIRSSYLTLTLTLIGGTNKWASDLHTYLG